MPSHRTGCELAALGAVKAPAPRSGPVTWWPERQFKTGDVVTLNGETRILDADGTFRPLRPGDG